MEKEIHFRRQQHNEFLLIVVTFDYFREKHLLDGRVRQILTASRKLFSIFPLQLLNPKQETQNQLHPPEQLESLLTRHSTLSAAAPSAGFCGFLNMLLKIFFSWK